MVHPHAWFGCPSGVIAVGEARHLVQFQLQSFSASHSQSNGNSSSHDELGPSSASISQAPHHPANLTSFATSTPSQLDDNDRQQQQQPPDGELANGKQANLAAHSLAQLTRDLEFKLHLDEKDWYHGVMSRQQCDQLLNAYADDGDFSIRNSETNAGDFSVSLKAPIWNTGGKD